MKLSCKRDDLLAGLHNVIGVVERRQTMPILSNVLLKAEEGDLTITATDLELELVAHVAVAVEQAGAITVPARKLFDICRGLPAGSDLSMVLEGQQVRLQSGRSRFVLSSLPAPEFPFLQNMEAAHSLTLPQSKLKHLFERTHFAMAQQDVRYYLNGLLLVMQPQQLRAVATDGHRLALSDIEMDTGVESPVEIIVPRKAVMEMQRVLDAAEQDLSVTFSPGQLQVSLPDKQFTTKLIDGRFPDYERVIPQGGDRHMGAEREQVREALARAAILCNEKFRGVRVALEGDRLRLQTQNPEHERAEEEVEVTYDGEPVEIGFNVYYLMDALGVMESERFTLELAGPDSSGLLYGQDDPGSKYVVMPMRL